MESAPKVLFIDRSDRLPTEVRRPGAKVLQTGHGHGPSQACGSSLEYARRRARIIKLYTYKPGDKGEGTSAPAPMAEQASSFTFPADIKPIPGNFSAAELTAYLRALGSYLRQGTRLYDLRNFLLRKEILLLPSIMTLYWR